MQIHDGFDNGETQSRSFLGACVVYAIKPVKYLGQMFSSNAAAGVLHDDFCRTIVSQRCQHIGTLP